MRFHSHHNCSPHAPIHLRIHRSRGHSRNDTSVRGNAEPKRQTTHACADINGPPQGPYSIAGANPLPVHPEKLLVRRLVCDSGSTRSTLRLEPYQRSNRRELSLPPSPSFMRPIGAPSRRSGVCRSLMLSDGSHRFKRAHPHRWAFFIYPSKKPENLLKSPYYE